MSKYVVNVRVLPGEPLDGRGKVCVHLFVRDPSGPFVEPHVLHQAVGADGAPIKQQLEARPTRGRLACDRRRLVAPTTVAGVTTVTIRSDDPRAVTCPKCMASSDYEEMMQLVEVR